MRLIEPVEYVLHLNTGETIEVFELDPGRVEALQHAEITEALRPLLDLCNSVTRLAADEAKRGYSDKLESQLRTSPIAALIKIDSPRCIEFRNCPSMRVSDCVISKIVGKKRKPLPLCWEYSVNDDISGNDRVMANDLARHIVHAWDQNKYVLVIVG